MDHLRGDQGVGQDLRQFVVRAGQQGGPPGTERPAVVGCEHVGPFHKQGQQLVAVIPPNSYTNTGYNELEG